jgi:uncharacterized protein YyaL (SSP411 family)
MKDAYKPVWFILFVVVGLIAVAGIGYLRSGDGPERVPWQEDFPAARTTSTRDSRPILLYFTASWCGPCQQMKKTTWADERVAEALKGYIPVKVDVDKQPALAEQYGIGHYPWMEIIEPDGTRKLLVDHYVSADEFLTLLPKK